jgi:cytoplasmic iron level regulating protein YaaA (DUF328/UPF0246 family)
MKIVISPAKSLDFETQLPTTSYTEYGFQKQSLAIDKVLKKKKPNELMDLMSISDKLADLNWNRNQTRNVSEITVENGRQAIYAFNGDVYIGLDAYSLSEDKINILQNKLRILSGLYGLLKPLDLIQPYRLEMGTKLPIGTNKNLYEFWKPIIFKELNSELSKDELFVNLASNEYFDAVDVKKLKVPVITPEFKGMMVRYIIDTNAETIDDLKGFNYEGYAFDSNLSNGNKLVFTR